MLTLRLFGGLSLSDADRPVPARATQRRRLALLAILAAGDERATSKDKLIALLWPEADRDHGRHLLSDSLYVLRETLGDELFRVAGDFVALDPVRLTSDVSEFRHALDAGDLLGAADIYGMGGSFLDGVHLVDSVEFERWVDSERGRLSADYQQALEALASEAAKRGDLDGAVAWRRRLAAESPLSSSAALALMHALADAGDLPGAVAFARVHTTLVQTELDCAPDARVVALAEELRARATHVGPTQDMRGASPATLGDEKTASADVVPATAVDNESRHRPARLRLAFVTGALSLAVVVYGALAWRGSSAGSAAATSAAAVAIVPFNTIGQSSDDSTFADGITENVVHALARSHGPRGVTATLAGRPANPAALRRIGESLHVVQVIEGDVQRFGERVRVRVRLVDAATDYTRWSGSYVGEAKDVLALQDDIGRAVVAALSVPRPADAGASRARQGTASTDAYDLYLHGRHQEELRSDTSFRAAIQSYRAAIAADPGFAAAYAGLAEAYALTGMVDDDEHFPPRETAPKAEAAALKAVALDDSLGEAHLAFGIVRLVGPIDFGQSELELKRALALNPTDRRSHEYLSKLYGWTDRPEAAVREARGLVDADPLSVTALRDLGRALLVSRRYDEALAQIERARTLGPPVRIASQMEGEIYAIRGMYPQAIAAFRTRSEPLQRALLGHALARSGDTTSARHILDDFRNQWRDDRGGAFEVAVVYAGLRDYDRALEWLDKSIEDSSIRGNIMDPMFDDVRADPRFAAVHRRLMGPR
jgi:DNA-binding SARP family transcriptional activator/TolB-like protein